MVYFNDASLHSQFPAIEPFRESLRTLWQIRGILVGRGLTLRVCRTVRLRQVTPTHTFNDFLGSIPKELRTRLLLWLDREGPFWDDERHHPDSEYFESCGQLVTDTALAEAAYLQSEGVFSPWVFSLEPSSFLTHPLMVDWLGRDDGDIRLSVSNGWNFDHAADCATALERPVSSWGELLEWVARECRNLLLSEDIRSQLPSQFIPNVAHRAKVLLAVLNQIVGFLKEGNDEEFQKLRTDWMQGDRARFSPSSESEINEFSSELTFKHPESDRGILCSWHGKIQTPQFRIHFEWPLPEGGERLFVAYIGPKITKR